MVSTAHCFVCNIGLVSFEEALRYENALQKLRRQEKVPDTLLLFEHPPTITLGKLGKTKNILLADAVLAERGIILHQTDRGGDVTINCPGQTIVHPVIDLHRIKPVEYLNKLTTVAEKVLCHYGIIPDNTVTHPGTWIKGKQIAAIGLKIRQNISTFGLSLNVNPQLSYFETVNLCGIEGSKATSIESELRRPVTVDEVNPLIVSLFAETFNYKTENLSVLGLQGLCSGASDS